MHYISTTDQGPRTNDNSEKKTSPTHKVFHQEEEKVQNKEIGEDGHLNTTDLNHCIILIKIIISILRYF